MIQRRHAPPEEFGALVARAVGFLEGMPAGERDRWLLFLSHIQALVYHDRPELEREALRELIVESVRTDPRPHPLVTPRRARDNPSHLLPEASFTLDDRDTP